MGYVDAAQIEALAKPLLKNEYGQYLMRMLGDRPSPRTTFGIASVVMP